MASPWQRGDAKSQVSRADGWAAERGYVVSRCWGLGRKDLMPQTPNCYSFFREISHHKSDRLLGNAASPSVIIFLPAFLASAIFTSACGLMSTPSVFGS